MSNTPDVIERILDPDEHGNGDKDQGDTPGDTQGAAAGVLNKLMNIAGNRAASLNGFFVLGQGGEDQIGGGGYSGIVGDGIAGEVQAG